jgi:hypothetical protein
MWRVAGLSEINTGAVCKLRKKEMVMRKLTGFSVVALVLTALTWLTACGPQEKKLSDTDQAAVLAFSEAATDNLFAGLIANDYATFSRDFDADMQAAIPATKFAAWKQDLDNKIGNCLSREVDQVTQLGEFYVVVYQAKFEQDEPVIVRVVFRVAEPHSISGLWFNSEKLRQK